MASSSNILSQTLQSVTVTKIEELAKQRNSFEQRKATVLQAADRAHDLRKKVAELYATVNELDGSADAELTNIDRWLQQSQYDPTVRSETLHKFEKALRSRLDVGTRRLDLADLYSRLLTEWIGSPDSGETESIISRDDDSSESFEMVQTIQKERLEQLRQKFAKVVFEPLETDEVEIDNYLSSFFKGDSGKEDLKRLRESVSGAGKWMLKEKKLLDKQSMKWCIKALLKNELLNDEKKATLREFLKDEAVMDEIKDVLNMRFANLKNWSWGFGDEGMPVVPRQSLNGKWRVMMDDDVLQALLTHWIGTRWAVSLKASLDNLFSYGSIWKRKIHLPQEQTQLESFYHAPYYGSNQRESVGTERRDTYKNHFFLAPLPSRLFEEAGGYDDDDDQPKADPNKLSPKDIKQLLLRTLATETLVHRSLDGEVAVVQSDFQWFATGIPHTSIFAVLRFIGFQEEWITFFKKALEPPLNMLTGEPVRTRKRGLPMAHIFEKFIGEVVLFFMDLAVNQEAEMYLYRFHDDLWLCGKPDRCAKAWQSMEAFAKVMGLEFNKNKTGSVYLADRTAKDPNVVETLPKGTVSMNFLVLDPESGRWVINQEHVQEHVNQLQKQLLGSKSVLEWVKTWNSCIGRFFSYTFGEPANCFGRSHVDKILETHKNMQAFLFEKGDDGGKTVSEHLKSLISRRFDVSDVPDAFLFVHESLGGLGLRNPFVPLLLVRDDLLKDPEERMAKFHKAEREEYESAKREFQGLTSHERWRRYRKVFPKDDEEADNLPPGHQVSASQRPRRLKWEDAQTFWSFKQFTRYRESSSSLLLNAYQGLMLLPGKSDIVLSDAVIRAWKQLETHRYDSVPFSSEADPEQMDSEAAWTVQYHAEELFDKCGGLSLLDTTLLPLGVLKALKGRKVTWQMVL